MADAPQHVWTGQSGQDYLYWIYPIDMNLDPVPANYIYAKGNGSSWQAIYIGETGDISDRPLEAHHKKACIEREGATHIHAHKSPDSAAERRKEEKDLVDKHNPPCND